MNAIAIAPIPTSSAGGDDGLAMFIVLVLGGPFLVCLLLLMLTPLYRRWKASRPDRGEP